MPTKRKWNGCDYDGKAPGGKRTGGGADQNSRECPMAYPTSAFENDAQRKALRSKGERATSNRKNGEEGTGIGVGDFFPEVWLFNDFNICMDELIKGIASEFDAPFGHRLAFPRYFLVCWSPAGVFHALSQSLCECTRCGLRPMIKKSSKNEEFTWAPLGAPTSRKGWVGGGTHPKGKLPRGTNRKRQSHPFSGSLLKTSVDGEVIEANSANFLVITVQSTIPVYGDQIAF
ncbi:hypothetical protein niasHT_029210 [Heterodera trifolii]|uniref:Uncharacterized protein n=1 Tax=Heterodera trifolii TaxID=157864 RepID=A0ABD2K0L3_9BILA